MALKEQIREEPGTMGAIIQQTDAFNSKFRSHLRFVEENDAAFICGLRADPNLNKHLSPSDPDVEKQRKWISGYKDREKDGTEFYFIIVSDGQDRGVVRIYDFRQINGERSFSWGSWIIPPPRVPGLVTFSAILMYEIGFDALKFDRAHFEVRKANTGVVAFHERSGAHVEAEDHDNFYFRYTPADYLRFREASEEQIREHRRDASITA